MPGAGHQGSSSDARAAAAAGGDVIGGELGLLGPELIRFLLGINRVSWGRARNWLLQRRAGGRAVFPQIPAEKPRSSSTRLDGACPVPTASCCPHGALMVPYRDPFTPPGALLRALGGTSALLTAPLALGTGKGFS